MPKYTATVVVKHYVNVEIDADNAESAEEYAGNLADAAVYALESGRWDELSYDLHLDDVKDIDGAECDVYDLTLKEDSNA